MNSQFSSLNRILLNGMLIITIIISPFRLFASGELFFNVTFENYLILPDTSIDSILTFEIGDTIETYLDGPNQVYVLEPNSIENDSMEMELWSFTDNQPLILLELTHQDFPIQKGLYGFNVSGMFESGTANYDDLTTYGTDPNPWDYLSRLRPATLRFPSGSGSKFMQLLGVDDGTGQIYKGYGYDINEILPYYDKTKGGMLPNYTAVLTDLSDFTLTDETWLDDNFTKDLEDYYKKWDDQTTFDPTDLDLEDMPDLAINQFVSLVDKIQEENGDYTIDVIVCIDIYNNTAAEAVEIVEFLMDHGVNVVGVELGNEVYFKFGRKSMGFESFYNYWDYITGGEYGGDLGSFDLSDAVPSDVLADHDFIGRFKTIPDLKIGLPGMNLPNCGFFPFKTAADDTAQAVLKLFGEDDCSYPEWNQQMLEHYSDTRTNGETYYAFDAIVLHPYYTTSNTSDDALNPNSNWGPILLPDSPLVCLDGAPLTEPIEYYSGPVWDYSPADSRLTCAFEGLAGFDFKDGNFRDLIKSRYNDAYEEHASELLFTGSDDEPEYKEIWTTEWNLLTQEPNLGAVQNAFYSTAANSFVHSEMFQEWFLKNIKANFDPHFRDDFFKYATVQNFIGNTPICLMNPSDLQDQVELGINDNDCLDVETANYYLTRTTYFQMELLREITANELSFLKSTTTMYAGNVNLPPTVFIPDPENNEVYVYYTNVKDSYQIYCIDPGTLGQIYTPDMDVDLDIPDDIIVYSINADQLYSTSGRSALFDINHAYDDCADDYDNRMEITGSTTSIGNVACPGGWSEDGGVCVRVPPISSGYFVIPYETTLRKGIVEDIYKVFPNPASTHFMVTQKGDDLNNINKISVEIYTLYGSLISTQMVNEAQAIDISALPVGVYNVLIKTEGLKAESETLIKMK
jgi:hypothetical protein